MKKDLTFNVDDYLKRLETIHHLTYSCLYTKSTLKEDLNVFLKQNFDLKTLDFYQLNGNFLIRIYVSYGIRFEDTYYYSSFFHLITDKFLVQITTNGINKIYFSFREHLNFIEDFDYENIRKILFDFIENADISNKITSFKENPINHDLFLSDIKNANIFIEHISTNRKRLNKYKQQMVNFGKLIF